MDPERGAQERPTRPVNVPTFERAAIEIEARGDDPQPATLRAGDRAPGERVTIPVAIHVPPLARRQIEALDIDVVVVSDPMPRLVEPMPERVLPVEDRAPPARDRAPRLALLAIGLAAGLALGWVAHSAQTAHPSPTRADLR